MNPDMHRSMTDYLLASPVVIGLVALWMWWDSTAMLNQATESRLKSRDLLGECLCDQRYGDDVRHRADVYLPPSSLERPAQGWPMAVFFYGGSWTSGHRQDYAFVGRTLAARGVVVVIADYRLHPQVRYPAFLEDSAAATAWAWQQAPGWAVNPGRVFLVGHSAGAYNAAMLSFDARWLAAHGMKPQQVAGFIGLAGPYNFLPLRWGNLKEIFPFPDTPVDTQPITHVEASSPPALLITAAADSFVSPTLNTEALQQRMQAVGARVEVRQMPRTSHITLVAAMAEPMRWLSPVLDEVTQAMAEPSAAQVAGERQGLPLTE